MSTWTVSTPDSAVTVTAEYMEMSASGALCFFAFIDPRPLRAADLVRAFARGRWIEVCRVPETTP